MEPSITSSPTCLHFSPSYSPFRGLWSCKDSSATQGPHCHCTSQDSTCPGTSTL